MKRIYIAHPLTAKPGTPWHDRDQNLDRYLRICAIATEMGHVVLSYVGHELTHRAGLTCKDGQDEHDYYLRRDEKLVEAADEVWQCCPDGLSRGVDREVAFAESRGIPVRGCIGGGGLAADINTADPSWPPLPAASPWSDAVGGLTVFQMQQESHAIAHSKGWWDDQLGGDGEVSPSLVPVMEKLMLIVTEVAEAAEDYRKSGNYGLNVPYVECRDGAEHPAGTVLAINDHPTARWHMQDHTQHYKPVGFASEMADIVIRVGDLCGALGIDLQEAIKDKARFNRTRKKRHGGKHA